MHLFTLTIEKCLITPTLSTEIALTSKFLKFPTATNMVSNKAIFKAKTSVRQIFLKLCPNKKMKNKWIPEAQEAN